MFYSESDKMSDYSYRSMQINSYISVFHLSPNSPAVDIYADGNLIIKGLAYKELSKYLPVPPGNYNIKVYPSGQMTTPVINTNVIIHENTIFNVAAIGTLPDISLFPIPEPKTAPDSGKPCVRFIHLSPNAPAVDIKLSDGTMVFNNIAYKNITQYVCIPAGTYTLNVSPTSTDNVVLTVPDVKLNSNNYYTIYAIGLVGKSPALEAIVVPEPR